MQLTCCWALLDLHYQEQFVFLIFGDGEMCRFDFLIRSVPVLRCEPWRYICVAQHGLWRGGLQAEKGPQRHTRKRNPAQARKLNGLKGLMVGLVNAPLGFFQAETSTNISIITEKPSDCQAQSPDVVDNMFELLVVKVSRCSSNTDKKLHCQFQSHFQTQVAVFSWQEWAFFLFHS